MKGKYHIVVQNNKLRYDLDVRRNITVIRGDSATGKTRLIALVEQAAALGEGSGVEVRCERPCRTLGGNDWNLVLPNLHGQIIFLDEESRFVKSQEFAEAVRASDNYFVIIGREKVLLPESLNGRDYPSPCHICFEAVADPYIQRRQHQNDSGVFYQISACSWL